jgi:putative ABC transport system ATP-binding protein
MIKAHNITHHYNQDIALDNINLTIQKGEFVAITGESGSGKSTLLSILSTLLKPSKGELFFENQPYNAIKNIDAFRQHTIGFIFQFHYLINYLTIQENIQIAHEKATEKEILALLESLGIKELAHRFAIARALINHPKVIFADEPTGNLDSKNSQNVFDLFKHLSQNGTTVIVATHDKNLALQAHRIIEVHDGKL